MSVRSLAWLGWFVATVAVAGAAHNPLIDAVALMCCGVLIATRGGPRRAVATTALAATVGLVVVRLIVSMIGAGSETSENAWLHLPSFTAGPAVGFGGPWGPQKFGAALESGLMLGVVVVGAAVLAQARSAAQWCDLAAVVVGRGALLLAPMLCLGEAVAMSPRGPGRAADVVRADQALASGWHRGAPPRPLRARSAGIAAVLGMAVTAGLLAVGLQGGLGWPGSDRRLGGLVPLAVVVVLWLIARVTVGGERILPAAASDWVALAAQIIGPLAVVAADSTGDRAAYSTPPGTWPGLPLWTVLGLVVATAAMALCARRGGKRA